MVNRLIANDVLDTLRESALVLSPEGHIEQVNSAFLSLFNKGLSEVQNRPLWDIEEVGKSTVWKRLFDEVRSTPEGIVRAFNIEHYPSKGDLPIHLQLNACRLVGEESTGNTARIFVAMDDVTEQRRVERENRQLRAAAEDTAQQKNELIREVFAAATEGKLLLCLSDEDLPRAAGTCTEPIYLTLSTLRETRMLVRDFCTRIGICDMRIDDFESAVGEAAMNAVIHGGGGVVRIFLLPGDTEKVQVWIMDNGDGIALEDLPRALLETGFSSKGTMGQGFRIILRTADRSYLYTGRTGTTIVLEQEKEPPLAAWLRSLDNTAL